MGPAHGLKRSKVAQISRLRENEIIQAAECF